MLEKVIETKSCKQCNINFDITDKDLEFYEKISPVFEGKKYNISTPTLCPECRQQRRFSFRNERKLYTTKSSLTGINIVSMFSPDKPYKVYGINEWWSDKWDPLDYGIDFDFSRSFFEQYDELIHRVPMCSLVNGNTQNSEYNNYIYGAKNCYMSSVVYYDAEDIYNSSRVYGGKNILDCIKTDYSTNCYSCVDTLKCFNCFYGRNLTSCNNCYHSRDLEGCSNCIGCANLINKEYYVFNKKVTKNEFINILKDINSGDFINECTTFINGQIFRASNNINCENSTGDYLKNCKNVTQSYDMFGSEDSKFLISELSKKCYDGIGGNDEFCYEYTRTGWSMNSSFTNDVIESSNILYSQNIYYSKYVFGCVGLKNKQYCIFNKQYTKEEYNKLVPKIINHMQETGEWGEFFPAKISAFGYNETIANEYIPLSKSGALENGFNWSNYELPKLKVEKIISANKLPENFSDIPDDILNWAIECDVTKKPFKIIKQELDFYRKHNLPIPKKHPDQRHLERMKLRNPRKLYNRKCDKCGIEMKTTYSPNREEIVYCEECYNKEIY